MSASIHCNNAIGGRMVPGAAGDQVGGVWHFVKGRERKGLPEEPGPR
jgi:hypothetical protein